MSGWNLNSNLVSYYTMSGWNLNSKLVWKIPFSTTALAYIMYKIMYFFHLKCLSMYRREKMRLSHDRCHEVAAGFHSTQNQ